MDTGTAGAGTDFHIGTGHFGKSGTASIPVPDTSKVRCDINTGTGHFGNFGTTSIPVPRIPVPYRTHPFKILSIPGMFRCIGFYFCFVRSTCYLLGTSIILKSNLVLKYIITFFRGLKCIFLGAQFF